MTENLYVFSPASVCISQQVVQLGSRSLYRYAFGSRFDYSNTIASTLGNQRLLLSTTLIPLLPVADRESGR